MPKHNSEEEALSKLLLHKPFRTLDDLLTDGFTTFKTCRDSWNFFESKQSNRDKLRVL